MKLRDLISIEGGRYHLWFNRWWLLSGLHIWIGPVGIHLFWPDFWKSRPDYCSDWRSEVAG